VSGPVPGDGAAGRLRYLDGLRGLAIAAVVLVHVSQLAAEPVWLTHVGVYGERGVQLFFIVSAITLLTIDRRTRYAPFLIRRLFRIAPMFYLGILLYLFVFGWGPRPHAPAGLSGLDIGLTLFFLHGWTLHSVNSAMPGGWSIGCEAMFYLLFPVLAVLVTSLQRALIFFLISCGVSAAVSFAIQHLMSGPPGLVREFSWFVFPAQLPAFAMGFVVFFAADRWRSDARAVCAARIACPLIAWLIVALAFAGSRFLGSHLLADYVLGVFVLAVALSPPTWLTNRVMSHIGLVSYSVYVIHFAVIEFARHLVMGSTSAAFAYPLVLAGAVALATLTYRFIEQPVIALGRRLARRIADPALRG
jgi:peptidoglycan/LPS O-acetylase OafA/YrhL